MSPTYIGVLFIPAALYCTILRPKLLVPLAVIAAVFQAGSVINGSVGSFDFGLPPFYFVAFCITVRLLLTKAVPGHVRLVCNDPARRIIAALRWFWLWSVASALVLPHVFRGVGVFSPREGIDQQFIDQTPLHWSLSNLAQALFLTLHLSVILFAVTVIRTEKELQLLLRSFYVSIIMVVTVGLWQHLASLKGWTFPFSILESNPAYIQSFAATNGMWQRISSTFTEPSYAGAFLAAAACGLLGSFLAGARGLWKSVAILGVLFVLFDTAATTGYAALAITSCLLLLFFNPFGAERELRWYRAKGWIVVFSAIALTATLLFGNADFVNAANVSTLDKIGGLSFIHRFAADLYALQLTIRTYGLGAGLGSNRPSSLFTALLSTVGLIGTVLFVRVLVRIVRAFPGRSAPAAFQLTFWSLIALLVGQTLAVPDLTFPVLWSLVMLVVIQIGLSNHEASERGIA